MLLCRKCSEIIDLLQNEDKGGLEKMKRITACLLLVCLLLGTVASAEGKLKVTHKNLIVYDGDDSGYFFARIENTGDAPVGVGTGSLVTFDEEDEIIFSDSWISTNPSGVMLDPGECVYVREFVWETALQGAEVADYKFSAEKRSYGDKITGRSAGVSLSLEGAGTYENFVYVTITNDTDKNIEAPYVICALYDAEGNIAFVGAESMSYLSIHADSVVTVRFAIDNDIMNYYQNHGVEIEKAEAMVYVAD